MKNRVACHHTRVVRRHVLALFPFIAMLALCSLSAGCFFSDGIGDIDLKRLKALMEKEQRLLVVDNRTALEYASGHIPGAVHIPEQEFYRLGSLLPPEKNTPIVFYCRGYG